MSDQDLAPQLREQGRTFPIQEVGPISWALAEQAYKTYVQFFGRDQSMERMSERGGFGLEEFAYLIAGKNPLKAQTATQQSTMLLVCKAVKLIVGEDASRLDTLTAALAEAQQEKAHVETCHAEIVEEYQSVLADLATCRQALAASPVSTPTRYQRMDDADDESARRVENHRQWLRKVAANDVAPAVSPGGWQPDRMEQVTIIDALNAAEGRFLRYIWDEDRYRAANRIRVKLGRDPEPLPAHPADALEPPR